MLKLNQRGKEQEQESEQERSKEKTEIGCIIYDLQQAMEAVRPENRQKSRRGILRAIPRAEFTLCSPFHQHIHTHVSHTYTFRLFLTSKH